MVQLRWRAAPELTAAYAAWQWSRGEPPVDERLLRGTRELLLNLEERLALAELSGDGFWPTTVLALVQGESEPRAITAGLEASACSPLVMDSLSIALTGLMTDLRLAILGVLPKLAEQLPLRARPLQEQWEARGPGLLRLIGKLTHQDLLPRRVHGLWMHPWLGGGGFALPEVQSVLVEAVLTNPLAELPEVVRIAWLVAAVGMSQPGANVLVAADRLPRVVSAALLPVTLSAAEQLDLVGQGPLQVGLALSKWRPPSSTASDLSVLEEWWSQFRDGRTPFPVALKALDRMLA
jgi:hypothetical protein